MLIGETIRSLFTGERLGFRLRVKPSWSGKVYGTYSVTGRQILFSSVLAAATGVLFLRLLALNVAAPPLADEAATLRLNRGHGIAARELRLPARASALERDAEHHFKLAHQLRALLGVQDGPSPAPGIGEMAGQDDSAAPGQSLSARLAKLTGDVVVLASQFRHMAAHYAGREEDLRYQPSVAPLSSAHFFPTSPFGRRLSPFTNLPELHRGQDLAAEMHARIVATADGVVVRVERDARKNAMGRYLVIDHAGRFQTYYGHCERIFVEEGESVRRHQIVAEVGNTGRSTGPHVHYEVRVGGEPRDPRQYLVLEARFDTEEQFRFE